jgi:hypothetical protein
VAAIGEPVYKDWSSDWKFAQIDQCGRSGGDFGDGDEEELRHGDVGGGGGGGAGLEQLRRGGVAGAMRGVRSGEALRVLGGGEGRRDAVGCVLPGARQLQHGRRHSVSVRRFDRPQVHILRWQISVRGSDPSEVQPSLQSWTKMQW